LKNKVDLLHENVQFHGLNLTLINALSYI